MTAYLLLAAPDGLSPSPSDAARSIKVTARWIAVLEQWGLLRAIAKRNDDYPAITGAVLSGLIVDLFDYDSALRIADGWGQMSGMKVITFSLQAQGHRA